LHCEGADSLHPLAELDLGLGVILLIPLHYAELLEIPFEDINFIMNLLFLSACKESGLHGPLVSLGFRELLVLLFPGMLNLHVLLPLLHALLCSILNECHVPLQLV